MAQRRKTGGRTSVTKKVPKERAGSAKKKAAKKAVPKARAAKPSPKSKLNVKASAKVKAAKPVVSKKPVRSKKPAAAKVSKSSRQPATQRANTRRRSSQKPAGRKSANRIPVYGKDAWDEESQRGGLRSLPRKTRSSKTRRGSKKSAAKAPVSDRQDDYVYEPATDDHLRPPTEPSLAKPARGGESVVSGAVNAPRPSGETELQRDAEQAHAPTGEDETPPAGEDETVPVAGDGAPEAAPDEGEPESEPHPPNDR